MSSLNLTRWAIAAILAASLIAAGVAAPVGAAAPPDADTRAALDALAAVQATRAGTPDPTRDLSMQLRDLHLRLDDLPGRQRQAGTDEFGRPTGLDQTVDTTNFRVHYTTTGPNAATPAFAAETAEVFEEVYAAEITAQGWARPGDDGARGGDNRIDVYLLELQDMGAFGFASGDIDSTCDPDRCTGIHGWMGMENDFVGYPPDPPGALRATTAHEFHHLIQYAEAFSTDRWLFEATATWQESIVYPDIDARTFYVESVTNPTIPLTRFGDDNRQYGEYVFMRWLADRFGPGSILASWRATLDDDAHSLAGIDAALAAQGSSFSDAFGRFAADTAFWNLGGFPRDVINGTSPTYPEIDRAGDLTDGQSLDVTLDHTAYTIYTLPNADQMGARLTVPAAVDGSVAVVAAGPSGVQVDVAQIVDGEAVASLANTSGASLAVVVANTDATQGPRAEDGSRTYTADGTTFSVAVGSDIVSTTPPPTTPPVVVGAITDGARVQADDAVAQAIATSQALFADGAASRVVLATSERFPDALAGAALAGSAGPVLFTPFGDDLDPRVAAEITRVTGGSAPVLILGGNAAVSDGAAAQAAAAGGNVACEVPLSTSCRYAGTGREATAALIAETVAAENPGTTALIARGDAFADALTGGAYAARAQVPVLLTPSTVANEATQAFLAAHPEITEVIVLGGTAAVDDATAAQLGATGRAAGAERTATSVEIAEQLWAGSGFGSGGVVLVNVRADDGWPAALSAAVASAILDAPQIGVESPPTGLSDSVAAYLAGNDVPVQAFGSTALISDAQLSSAVAAS